MKLKFDFNKIIGYFNLNSEKGLSINSSRDWKVLLVCSSLFLILVFAIDINSLLSVKGKMNLAVEGTSAGKEPKVNEIALESVLMEVDARAENFRRIYFSSPAASSTATSPR